MLTDIFNNDPTYREQDEEVKKVMKAKKEMGKRTGLQTKKGIVGLSK
jgi:hypothetical protein